MAKDKRAYADRREYLIKAVTRRRQTLKKRAIEYMGGKCVSCGYNSYQGGLEFHHLDPVQKEFGISEKGYSRSWESLKQELDKCILVCSNCHKEIEAGVKSI